MWILIVLCILIGGFFLCWVLVKGDPLVRLLAATAALLISCSAAFYIGQGWERMRNYDQYVWRFSQYSRHIRGLAERQEISELTNAVILFDSRFYPRHDPKELQNVVWQILKIGPYYQGQATNSTMSDPARDNP